MFSKKRTQLTIPTSAPIIGTGKLTEAETMIRAETTPVLGPSDLSRETTRSPADSTDSNSSSSQAATPLSETYDNIPTTPHILGNIITNPGDAQTSEAAQANKRSGSPDYDADPDFDPFNKRIKEFLIDMNKDPPAARDFQLISIRKLEQKNKLLNFISQLTVEELKSLSLHMNSIQVGNLTDRYFKTIRTECGFYGWFQSYGNTTTWQAIRSAVKDQLADKLVRSEQPGIKLSVKWLFYHTLLQIFQQPSGRLPLGKTRTERKFINDFQVKPDEPEYKFSRSP